MIFVYTRVTEFLKAMGKFMIQFRLVDRLDLEFFALMPEHRARVDRLIEEGVISLYALNTERTHGWVVISADSLDEALSIVERFPIYKYMRVEIDQLLIFDGETMRLPKVSLN